MIRVTTNTGEVFSAPTASTIVRKMIEGERLGASKTSDTFMRNTANRCLVWNGSDVSTESAEEFLRTLEAAGFILTTTEPD